MISQRRIEASLPQGCCIPACRLTKLGGNAGFHNGGGNNVFLDGHAKWLKSSVLADDIWGAQYN